LELCDLNGSPKIITVVVILAIRNNMVFWPGNMLRNSHLEGRKPGDYINMDLRKMLWGRKVGGIGSASCTTDRFSISSVKSWSSTRFCT